MTQRLSANILILEDEKFPKICIHIASGGEYAPRYLWEALSVSASGNFLRAGPVITNIVTCVRQFSVLGSGSIDPEMTLSIFRSGNADFPDILVDFTDWTISVEHGKRFTFNEYLRLRAGNMGPSWGDFEWSTLPTSGKKE